MRREKFLNGPIEADETLDTMGLYCPLPVVKTAERIKEMREGQVLEVISDDGGIQADLPAWCAGYGHEYLGLVRDSDRWRLYVRKGPAS